MAGSFSGAVGNVRRNPAAAWRHLDLVLLGAVTAIALLGGVIVYSATRGPAEPYSMELATKQALFIAVGFVLMLAVTIVDYRVVRDNALLIFGGVCALLVLVLSPVGSSTKGAQAWFQVGPFQFQPSELAKIGLIAALATIGAHFRGDIDVVRTAALMGIAAVPLMLIMLQPDLGTALVLVGITAGILLVAGTPARYLAAIVAVAALGAFVLMQSNVLKEYQTARLTSFLAQDTTTAGDPELREARYNLDQSKTAIGNGGLMGQGMFEGSQTRLAIVPEQHTDFIFTALAEQLGFVGAGSVLALFSVLAWRIWRTAQLARDPFGSLLCVGVLCMFLFQIFENVGMTMGIMPVTGIPLPFVSYGGSSTIAYFIAVGLVLNVHARRFS